MALNCLTAQRLLPKLSLTKYMSSKQSRLVLVFIVGVVFLAGQFHFCADLSAAHICPFCGTASSAILTPTPSVASIPVLGRLEVATTALELAIDVSRATSPRAPPAL